MFAALFLQLLETDPFQYLTIIVVVVFSIVLHELGHAYAAVWEGDDTPAKYGHLDANPLVHMGPTALVTLALFGISWGQCPVNPRNFRHGRNGEALVAFAGPAVNLVLMATGAALYGILYTLYPPIQAGPQMGNLLRILEQLAIMNGALFLLNMIPIPPLDGFTVASSLSGAFRRLAAPIERHAMVLFLLVFLLGSPYLFGGARAMAGFVASLASLPVS